MIVTKIEMQKHNKNKVSIFCDDEYSFSLNTETLLKNHISVGSKLKENIIENLINEDNALKALESASNYVAKGIKSRKQVRDFLKKKEYNTDVISQVISKLEEYNLIDDNTYINAFVHDHKQYGTLKLKQLLLDKGISKQKLDEYFSEFESDLKSLQSLKDKYLKNKENNYENIVKCKKYLLSHGFSYEEINRLEWSDYEDWN